MRDLFFRMVGIYSEWDSASFSGCFPFLQYFTRAFHEVLSNTFFRASLLRLSIANLGAFAAFAAGWRTSWRPSSGSGHFISHSSVVGWKSDWWRPSNRQSNVEWRRNGEGLSVHQGNAHRSRRFRNDLNSSTRLEWWPIGHEHITQIHHRYLRDSCNHG